MNLDIFRLSYGQNSTPGRLSVNGLANCVTLELPFNDGQNRHDMDCIPPGVYPVVVNFSNAHQKEMMQIMDVPNRDGIRFDVANFPSQLLGCVAVGLTAVTDSIANSQAAYDPLFAQVKAALDAGEGVTVEIHSPPLEAA